MDERVLKLANAILYEGYSLYPYRANALKNRQRWHFGVLYPRAFCESEQANDAWMTQAECLVAEAGELARLCVSARFLQLIPDAATAREVTVNDMTIANLAQRPYSGDFDFYPLSGRIEISASFLAAGVWKVSIRVINRSLCDDRSREQALNHALVSTHLILSVETAQFLSAIDPPDALREWAGRCKNVGTWPVLMGAESARDTMLCAPIILSDHPQISVQSAGDQFDCTEIDELLALRILTLTDDEKALMCRDERTRALLERTESLDAETLGNLHGIGQTRDASPDCFEKGQRVRLRPKGRTDIFDLVLDGKIGIVQSIERDYENNDYVTVTIEDDPGRDLGSTGQPGHRFFFRVDEVETV